MADWNRMRRFIMSFLMLGVTVVSLGQEASQPVMDDGLIFGKPKDDDQLPESPFKLAEGDHVDVGELTERSERMFVVKLENHSEEEVFFKRVMSSCACLEILKMPSPGKIPPHGVIEVHAKLIGSKLTPKEGKFGRSVYIEARGRRPSYVNIYGTFRPFVSVKPSAELNLGQFAGIDVPWKRVFTIALTKPEDTPEFTLLPPKENQRFSFSLTKKEDAGVFEFVMTPKLPIKPGKIDEFIEIPTTGAGENQVVRLHVKGEVTGIRMLVKPMKLTVKADQFAEGKSGSVQFAFMEYKSEQRSSVPHIGTLHRQGWHSDNQEGELHGVGVEEKEAYKNGRQNVWKLLQSKLTVVPSPYYTVTSDIQPDCLVYRLEVKPEILKAEKGSIMVELQKEGHRFVQIPLVIESK